MARTLLDSRAMGMRQLAALALLTIGCSACATDDTAAPLGPQPLDTVWADSIHDGDLIAMIPGTGSYDALGAPIEAVAAQTKTDDPTIDVRQNATIAGDSVVLEQAIAAAHRAGYTAADLEAGKLTFGMWGAGFTTVTAFEYISYEGIQLHVVSLGGENSCATGSIFANLLGYNTKDAVTDANALYGDLQTWLAANPSATGVARDVVLASHSWGGALSEYMIENFATIEGAHGSLADTGGSAQLPFTIADGVPAFILTYTLAGPGLHQLPNTLLYEVDRPDDPVHAMDPSGDGDGHMYNILFGSDFEGSYGITTEQLSCGDTPGECPVPPPAS